MRFNFSTEDISSVMPLFPAFSPRAFLSAETPVSALKEASSTSATEEKIAGCSLLFL
jgi:hypothetical protein